MPLSTLFRRALCLPTLLAGAALLASACSVSPTARPLPASDQPALIGRADVGKQLYDTQCLDCHAVDHHRIGPLHRGVVGRLAGSAPGYDYSTGLKRSTIRWTPETLDRWLSDPDAYVQNQQMDFKVEDAQERADLIAYLATLK